MSDMKLVQQLNVVERRIKILEDKIKGLTGQWNFSSLHNDVKGKFPTASLSIGAESSNVRVITVQLQDQEGNSIADRRTFDFVMSTSQYGVPAAVDGISISEGVQIQAVLANAHYRVQTTENGRAKISVTVSSTATKYVRVIVNGEQITSSPISWS